MNIRKAAFYGALLWVVIFFYVSALMFGLKIQIPSTTYYLINVPVFAILVGIASYFYFKGEKTGAKNGLFLGVIMLLVGVVLDAVITIPLFIKDYMFFFRTEILAGYAEGLIVATLMGLTMKKKAKKDKK